MSELIVRSTTNVTQWAAGDKNGLWTTVVAAALCSFRSSEGRAYLSILPLN